MKLSVRWLAVSKTRLLRHVSMAIIALVIGAATATIRLGHEVDIVMADNAHLMDRIEQLSHRLILLERMNVPQQPYVEAIEIVVRGVDRTRPAVEQQLKSLLTHLIGEQLIQVHAATIHQLLERPITVEGQKYKVEVKYIYVTPTLRAIIDVKQDAGTNITD